MGYRNERHRAAANDWKKRERDAYLKNIQKDNGRENLSTRANQLIYLFK